MSATCPLCRQAVAPDELHLDADRHWVARGGRHVQLPPAEFAIAALLARTRPHVLSREAILHRLYTLDDRYPCSKLIDVYLCRMRRHLRPLGIEIVNSFAAGWTLKLVPVEAAAAA